MTWLKEGFENKGADEAKDLDQQEYKVSQHTTEYYKVLRRTTKYYEVLHHPTVYHTCCKTEQSASQPAS